MNNIDEIYRNINDLKGFTEGYLNYLARLFAQFDASCMNALGEEFEDARARGSALFVIGNGGSASTATSMGNDLGFDILKKTGTDAPFRILPLTDNVSALTAIANDVGYEDVFLHQLRVHYRPGDRLLLISASGNSPNILKAARWVRSQGGRIIGFVGFGGGEAKALCDVVVHVDTLPGEYGPVEDFHLIINHILSHWFQNKLRHSREGV